MNKIIKTILLMIIAILIAVGGYTTGVKTTTAKYEKEKEILALIEQSSLEGLGEIEGTIYVTGHKIPDCDTVSSSVAYANLLNLMGYDAKAVMGSAADLQTQYVYENAGLPLPEILENAAGLNMVLMDHSDYLQAIDGMADANILGIVDHHGVGSITTGKPIVYEAKPIGSTATIIWSYYKESSIEIDKQIAHVMMGAVLSDTSNLKSNSTTYADRKALEDLAAIAGVTDTDAYYQEMYKKSISYEGMSDEEIFFSDYKVYEANGKKYGIGCINAYDEDIAKDLASRMKELYSSGIDTEGVDILYAQISIFHDDISITYLVPNNEEAGNIIEKAFKDDSKYVPVFDGISYRFEPGYSRKAVLVPALNAALEAE